MVFYCMRHNPSCFLSVHPFTEHYHVSFCAVCHPAAGYQVLVGIFFLLCLPINILFNTAAVSTAAVVTVNRQAALNGPGVPTASFTGQGRGKVGLADYPRPPTNCWEEGGDDCDVSEWMNSPGTRKEPSSSSGSTGSSTSSSSSGGSSAAAGKQRASSDGGATGSKGDAAGATTSSPPSSSSGSSGSSVPQGQQAAASTAAAPPKSNAISSSSNSMVPQPAPAPALPWLTVVQERSKPPPLLGLKASLAAVQEAWSNQVSCRIQGLWRVDLLFNLWALPLQAASLAVIPVFWTFPRLLGIQLALPAAVLGGVRGDAALEESRKLMRGFQAAYAWPFVWLILAGRLLEVVREVVLLSMPGRWWTEVPEVPLVATAVFFAARVVLLRLQDLLPLAAYLLLVQRQKGQQGLAAEVGSSR